VQISNHWRGHEGRPRSPPPSKLGDSDSGSGAVSRLCILAFAYACEPHEGSEPGAGWMWARMLARTGDVWVVTRANNRASIEEAMDDVAESNALHFIYVDLPGWARFWKRGQRGVRLYYLLWQAAALVRVRTLRRDVHFDLVWHLTLANAWLGSLAPLAGRSFVYGPVGGGVGTRWGLLPSLGVRGGVFDVLRQLSRGMGRYVNPIARLAWWRASVILVQNPETRRWLPRRHQMKAQVFPNALVEHIPPRRPAIGTHPPIAIFAGRLVAWKGVALAIQAVALTDTWVLVVCGEGPDERRLRRLANRLGAGDRVYFYGWRPRDELFSEMLRADAFLYPSIHDDAGWVVAEAMACGLPVICLDRGGPPTIAGPAGVVVSSSGGSKEVAQRLAAALLRLEQHDREFEQLARRTAEGFTSDVQGRRVADVIGHDSGASGRSALVSSRKPPAAISPASELDGLSPESAES
jgi:glycosyltransferase involved in cell wall biosynthesis